MEQRGNILPHASSHTGFFSIDLFLREMVRAHLHQLGQCLQMTLSLMCSPADSVLLSLFSFFPPHRLLTVLVQQSNLSEINHQDNEVSLPTPAQSAIACVRVQGRVF